MVIDSRTDRLVASLKLGVVPRQALVSLGEALLIATDEISASIVDLETAELRGVELPHPAQRLTLGGSGWLLAVADLAGSISLLDLRRRRVLWRLDGLGRLRDLMFVDQDGLLYLAGERWAGVGVVDVNTGRLTGEIAPFRPASAGGAASLARTPNGRQAVMCSLDGGAPTIIDLESGVAVGELAEAEGADAVVPSGTGQFLFAPDSRRARLRIFRAAAASPAILLDAAPAMTGVHCTWLDSTAFAPSAAQRRVLVYDLDRLSAVGSIALPGAPGPGSVTADSRKLYLPLNGPAGLAVIDGQTRTLLGTIPLPSEPLAAIVPGGWGVCH